MPLHLGLGLIQISFS